MAKICAICDSDSDTSDNQDDITQTVTNDEPGLHRHLPPVVNRGGLPPRQRNHSVHAEDLQGLTTDAASEDGDLFRRRSQSAPPVLWAAKKYGVQLRRMSDEFDNLMEKGMKRVKSESTARQMHASPSWLSFLWSHKESEAEYTSSLTAQDSRPAE